MKEITTSAIIYRIYKYSDRSAVAMAFSPEFGKFKLFMPRAYSSKSGFMTFIPGTVTFQMKDNSDLHKFISFAHEPSYYPYTQTPDIIMRLHLLFDFFDHLYAVGQGCKVFWQLCLKFDEGNYRKVLLYSIYRLLIDSGVNFHLACSRCGADSGDMTLIGGELFCTKCGRHDKRAIAISGGALERLQTFADNDKFRETEFDRDEELELLAIFNSHIDSVLGKAGVLKSYNVFMEVV
ncbi:MAG: DNA repair protein RecO C-terminal domain-containing protein [Deferribacteraceae bacterium]|jgi:recombinational DNA repair protein (RecF pathway)|nr:DNA repair protein RecO C-terminal domain-containing protein [Deferribacteraceae bacterium]